MSHIKYRPEIDGLRSIGVLMVIFYHAGFKWVPGGFVGVDIFFVISGYLITKIIFPEIIEGRFRFLRFYERRARRIFPALFLVLLSSTIAALMVLTPDQLKTYGQSLMAVIFYVSNYYFYSSTGYFEPNAEEIPLLHTWSLSVEEQFYLLFPLLLILVMRIWPTRTKQALVAGTALSLSLCVWRQHQNHTMLAFFDASSRAWELLFGALLATGKPSRAPSGWHSAAATVGLAMVLFPAAAYNSNSYPGLPTVVPVAGAGLLLLYAKPFTWVGATLARRPFVQVGLISYSAYLWHQPLFAMSFHLSGAPPDALKYTLVAATLLLAYLSWRLVEVPFRDSSRTTSRAISLGSLACVCTLLMTGYVSHAADGLPERFKADFTQLRPVALPAERNHCQSLFPGFADNCLASLTVRKGEPVDVLVFGDSHAYALAAGIIAMQPRLKVVSIGRDGCPPFFGVERYHLDQKVDCGAALERLAEYFPLAGKVLLVGRYAFYAEGSGFGRVDTVGRRPGEIHVQLAGSNGRTEVDDYAAVLAKGLQLTASKLSGAGEVFFVHQVPELGFDPKVCVDYGFHSSAGEICAVSRETVLKRQLRYRSAMNRVLSEEKNIRVVDPMDVLCNKDDCRASDAGVLNYRDDDHISIKGANRLFEAFLNRVGG